MADDDATLELTHTDGSWEVTSNVDRIQNPKSLLNEVYDRLEHEAGYLTPDDRGIVETPEYLLIKYSQIHDENQKMVDDFRDCYKKFGRLLSEYPTDVVDGARHDLMIDAVLRGLDSLEAIYWQTRFNKYEASYREIRFLMELYAVADGLFEGDDINKYSELFIKIVDVDDSTTKDEIFSMLNKTGQKFKRDTVQRMNNSNQDYKKTKRWLSFLAIHPYQVGPGAKRSYDQDVELGIIAAGHIFLIQFAGMIRKLITEGNKPDDSQNLVRSIKNLTKLQETSTTAFWKAVNELQRRDAKPGWLHYNVDIEDFYHSFDYSQQN